MDFTFRRFSIIIFVFILISCKEPHSNQEDSKFTLFSIARLFIISNRLSISGTAVKGIVKNAAITVTPLNADGTCNTARILANTSTDTNGDYSLVYNKTGGMVCITVSPKANRESTLFDEKTNSDLTLNSDSSFKLVTILPESKIVNRNRKNILASPFSRMLGSRLQNLIKTSGENPDPAWLYKKASKEIVIRFGLSAGLSSVSKSIQDIQATVANKDYPELEDIEIDLQNPQNSFLY